LFKPVSGEIQRATSSARSPTFRVGPGRRRVVDDDPARGSDRIKLPQRSAARRLCACQPARRLVEALNAPLARALAALLILAKL
jgi:hypothetical protein